MSSNTFETDMAPFDQEWDGTEADEGGRMPLFTDGTHQGKINTCRIVEHEDFGWQWEIGVVGTDSNTGAPASMRKWHGLPPSEEGYKWVKGEAVKLGYRGSLSKLQEACASGMFDDLPVEIFVKSKPSKDDPARTFSNMYINGVTGQKSDELPAAQDDDIPF